MTAILTPEEVTDAWVGASDPRNEDMSIHDFAASLESAILAKLASRAGALPEPVDRLWVEFRGELKLLSPRDDYFTIRQLRTRTASLAARVEVLERALTKIADEWPYETVGALGRIARAVLNPTKEQQ